MKNKHHSTLAICLLALGIIQAKAQLVSTFESFNLPTNTYLNGSGAPVQSTFTSGNVIFPNVYQTDYAYWSDGWAYSTMRNDSTAGYTNLYSVYGTGGNNLSQKYGVGQQNSFLRIANADKGEVVKGLYVNNGSFTALSMKNGDQLAKKFGGITGNDPDFCVLTIKKFLNGIVGTDSVNFYLADYRFVDNAQDYIVKNWTWVDLSLLGNVDSLRFFISSSDNGQFGINTPTFFCIDDVVTNSDTADFENLVLSLDNYWNKKNTTLKNVFVETFATYLNSYSVSNYGDYWRSGFAISAMKDTTTPGYQNLYSCYAGKGADSSDSYAVGQNNTIALLTYPPIITENRILLDGMYISNSTYAALSMKNGDAFAKKFGGTSGNDSDYFLLTVKGYQRGPGIFMDSVNFYLADFRFTDNSKDYIVKDWVWVDLSSLGNADSLSFFLSSSDNGQFGMNTPGFFAMDNLTYTIMSGLNERGENFLVNMYPNPAQNSLTIQTKTVATVSVFNLNGKLLLQEKIDATDQTINFETLQTGLYIVNVTTNEGVAIRKIMKQ